MAAHTASTCSAEAERCPECGQALSSPAVAVARERRWFRLARHFALLIVVLGALATWLATKLLPQAWVWVLLGALLASALLPFVLAISWREPRSPESPSD